MLHIYYGFGRGKTSTLNGTVLRSIEANLSIDYFRFLKGRETGENAQLKKLGLIVQNFHHTDKFTMDMTEEEKKETRKVVLKGLQSIQNSKADVIIIDEFLDLVETGHASDVELLKSIEKHLDNNKDVLVSGHYKLANIFKKADLITFFKSEKHYFDKGVAAKRGIEY